MAKGSGGGGAFGWTLLGFLTGIAATLGVQILMGDGGRPSRAEASTGSVHITVRSSEPPAKPVKKVALAPSAAPHRAAAAVEQPPAAEMADDAAAAGMTSRINPASDPATINN